MNAAERNTDEVSYSEQDVPTEGISETAEDVIQMLGGRVVGREESALRFTIPRRRADESSGALECVLEWDVEAEGTVRLTSDAEIEAGRMQRIALLVVGAAGALAFTLWPFFPMMGPLAGVGLVLAIAVYLLTLRRSPHGLIGGLLHEIVRVQELRRNGG